MNALADALEAINRTMIPGSELIAARCRGLMRGYDARWLSVSSSWTVLGVEDYLTSELWNPATEAKSRSFTLAGKLDVRTISDGRQTLIDHKTTSEDISDPNAPFWHQVMVEGQPRHYQLLEWLNGRRTEYAIWDVVRKPQISPKKLSAVDLRTAVARRQYFDYRLTDQDVLDLNAEGRETLDMYEARLANDCTVERPDHYFQRRPVALIEEETLEHAKELWDLSKELLQARVHARHPKNSKACIMFGSPCKFLGICSGFDTAESDNWTRKKWMHAELPAVEGHDGRGVLTNSRLGTFLTCRRKHFFEYELGLERVDAEEREALVFGTLWHNGQEAWWNSLKGASNGNSNTDSPVNEIGKYVDVVGVSSH